ncbi:2941_t:CDS:2, partial [Acaulospora colombiana]
DTVPAGSNDSEFASSLPNLYILTIRPGKSQAQARAISWTLPLPCSDTAQGGFTIRLSRISFI